MSRQRVSQLVASDSCFPAPEVELAAGRIWARQAIEEWVASNASMNKPEGGHPPASVLEGWPSDLRAIFDLAQRESMGLNHHWVGLDHLWLAILRPDCPGSASSILARRGLSVNRCRNDLIAALGDPFEGASSSQAVTTRLLLVMERARLRAEQLQDPEASSQHALLALAQEGAECYISRRLSYYNIDLASIHELVLASTEVQIDHARTTPSIESNNVESLGTGTGHSLSFASSPAGHDPTRRRPWGSGLFIRSDGEPILQGEVLLQYFVDRDGYPIRTIDGRLVHVMVDEHGHAVLDAEHREILVPVEQPAGSALMAD